MVNPVAVEIVMQLVDDIVGCGDVFQLAQHAMPAVGDRVLEQQTLLLQLDVIRAPRRTQDCNDHAYDREQHDHGNRNDTAGAQHHGIAAAAKLSKLRDGYSPHSRFPGGLRPFGAHLTEKCLSKACRGIRGGCPGVRRRAIQAKSLTTGKFSPRFHRAGGEYPCALPAALLTNALSDRENRARPARSGRTIRPHRCHGAQ